MIELLFWFLSTRGGRVVHPDSPIDPRAQVDLSQAAKKRPGFPGLERSRFYTQLPLRLPRSPDRLEAVASKKHR